MKKLLLIQSILLISMCMYAQNFEEFKKQREQGVQNLKQDSDNFAKNREAEYQKFKKMYEDEFEKYKKNYTDYLNGEIALVDLMASDDNISVKPLDDKYKPKEYKSSAASEKKVIEKEKSNIAKMTSNQALSSFSKSKDKVQRVKEGIAALRTLNQSFEVTSTASEPKIDNTVVPKEKPQEKVVVIVDEEEEAEKAAAAKADSVKRAEEFAAAKAAEDQRLAKEAEARRADEEADAKAAEEARKAKEAADAAKAAEEARLAEKAKTEPKASSSDAVEVTVPKGKPTDYKRISSPFGERIHPITHKKSTHKGVDMAANNMTPIYATADGMVVYAKVMGGYGNFIKINHENGYKTAYAHLEKIATSNSTKVHRGDLIGYVGSTGQSTGNHLHYEVYYEDKLIDPEKTL